MHFPTTIEAAFSTFWSNDAAIATAARAAGTAVTNHAVTASASNRLFGVILHGARSKRCATSFQAAADEVGYDRHRLRRDEVAHREFVILDLDTMLLEN